MSEQKDPGESMEPSERLKDVIRKYNLDGDVLVDALAHDVTTPSLEWFPEEFEQALLAGAFTTEVWGACYNGGLDDDQTDYVDMDLRDFWRAIHPDRPYPLDEGGSA